MKQLHFCYVYRQVDSTFEIENSIRIIKELYPKSLITVIGDKIKGVNHIPYNHKRKVNRASRIAEMLLILSKRFDDFVLMYDDIFMSEAIEINNYTNGVLRRKSNAGYNLCVNNTIEFLNHFDKPIKNYDAHQPFIFNSEKLKELYSIVDINHPHLPKSLYGNYFNINSIEIDNLKVQTYKDAIAKLDKYKCFSSTDNMCERTKQLIKELPYLGS